MYNKGILFIGLLSFGVATPHVALAIKVKEFQYNCPYPKEIHWTDVSTDPNAKVKIWHPGVGGGFTIPNDDVKLKTQPQVSLFKAPPGSKYPNPNLKSGSSGAGSHKLICLYTAHNFNPKVGGKVKQHWGMSLEIPATLNFEECDLTSRGAVCK